MWLIEQAVDGDNYWPINTEKLIYISDGKDNNSLKPFIKFHLIEESNVKWIFDKIEDRDNYLTEIRKVLPRLNTGIGKVSL